MKKWRIKAISDILNWSIEDSEHKISDERLDEIRTHLIDLSGSDLEDYWVSTVGEWLNSRDDIDSAESQWNKIMQGKDTDYGFIVWGINNE